MGDWRLVADVGGTNARFGCVDDSGAVSHIQRVAVRAFPTFAAAISHYMDGLEAGFGGRLVAAAVGAAGPVSGGRVVLTNADWMLDASAFAGLVPADRVVFVNDLQAVAAFLPYLMADDAMTLKSAGPGCDLALGSRIAINVGTGFGASSVHAHATPGDVSWHTVATEAGHMSADCAGLGKIVTDLGLPSGGSVENVLSGAGVAKLANALAADSGIEARFRDAGAVFAPDADCQVRSQVAKQFARALGTISRNLVLAHGAWGGAYLVGSVVQGWAGLGGDTSLDLLAAFEDRAPGAPMAQKLSDVPICLITRANPELHGLARVALAVG